MDPVALGRFGRQPPRQILRNYAQGLAAGGKRIGRMGPHSGHHAAVREPGAGGIRAMRTIWQRIWALFRRGRLDGELRDEIASHLAMQEEEFRGQGMDAATARRAARREFGGVAQTEEIYRERRGIPWIEIAAKDVAHALGGLRRNPGFTAAAVVSLALGI